MYIILWIHKLKVYNTIYVNVEITNICLILIYKVFHEDINIDLSAKMI